jgi:glycerol-3-phosphate dehydrogenase
MEREELDVLVIGGGVTGTGAALDAVTRGLNTGLVEMRDWASGTSSRSTKLLHGGLRYLEMLDFGLVREALRERGLVMQKLAPYLTRPIPFIYPLTHKGWERLYVGSGILLYDVMAKEKGASKGVPNHKHLSKSTIMKLFPGLDPDVCVGAIRYYDGQVDDARHTMLLARTAAHHGAHVASRAQVVRAAARGRPGVGAVVKRPRDREGPHEVRARAVINATGVWTDEMQALLGEEGEFTVKASKGIHILVPRDRIKAKVGMILRTPTSVLFTIPWHDHWIIGTTDTEYDLDKADPTASAEDIEYVLGQANRVLKQKLTKDDIVGTYAGLRPLVAGHADSTAKLSREHLVIETTPGHDRGGRREVHHLPGDGLRHGRRGAGVHGQAGRAPASPRTCRSSVWTATGPRGTAGSSSPRRPDCTWRASSTCSSGTERSAEDVLAIAPRTRPPRAAAGRRRLPQGRGRVRRPARRVHCTSRTSSSAHPHQHGGPGPWREAAPVVADLMAEELGWSDEQRQKELDAYLKRIEAELKANAAPTDEEAQQARLEAPDVVALA